MKKRYKEPFNQWEVHLSSRGEASNIQSGPCSVDVFVLDPSLQKYEQKIILFKLLSKVFCYSSPTQQMCRGLYIYTHNCSLWLVTFYVDDPDIFKYKRIQVY